MQTLTEIYELLQSIKDPYLSNLWCNDKGIYFYWGKYFYEIREAHWALLLISGYLTIFFTFLEDMPDALYFNLSLQHYDYEYTDVACLNYSKIS